MRKFLELLMNNNIIKIRASSLSEVFDCPARWAAKHIDNIKMPTNSKALLGTSVHASTALYDQSVLDGSGITIEDAKAAAVDVINNPVEDVIWDDDKPQDLENIALSLHDRYCYEIAPIQNYKAVEIRCESLVIEDLNIALTGTTDRIYENPQGEFGIRDIKTGKAAVGADGIVATKGHAYQMGVYELLAENASGIPINAPAGIIGLNTAKTAAAQRIGIGEIIGAREVLIGNEESPGILQMAADLIHGGNFYGNPKSMLCHRNYCPIYNNCKFRK